MVLSNGSVAVADAGFFGGLCFLGFGGNPFSFFPDSAERETAGATPRNTPASRSTSSAPRLVLAAAEARQPWL